MTNVPSTTNETYECDACCQQMHGYSWPELSSEGWKRHVEHGVSFTMCSGCERAFAERRLARAVALAQRS